MMRELRDSRGYLLAHMFDDGGEPAIELQETAVYFYPDRVQDLDRLIRWLSEASMRLKAYSAKAVANG